MMSVLKGNGLNGDMDMVDKVTIRKETDCYFGFVCPYNAKSNEDCEHYCKSTEQENDESTEENV